MISNSKMRQTPHDIASEEAQASSKFLAFNEKANTFDLLIPIMLGTNINADNTCQTGLQTQEFFGDSDSSAKKTLERYAQAIRNDLEALETNAQIDSETSSTIAAKQQRLSQIEEYRDTLTRLLATDDILSCFSLFPKLPRGVHQIFADTRHADNNGFAMLLSPEVRDDEHWFRTPEPTRVFNFRVNDLSRRFKNGLSVTNASSAKRHLFKTNFIATILPQDSLVDYQTEMKRRLLRQAGETSEAQAVDFSRSSGGLEINEVWLESIMDDVPDSRLEYRNAKNDIVETLINGCAPEFFLAQEDPFRAAFLEQSDPAAFEKLSITIQFYLGICHIYCVANNIYNVGFPIDIAMVMNGSPSHCSSLAASVKLALEGSRCVMSAIDLYVFNQLITVPPENIEPHLPKIHELFHSTWALVKDAPHHDEFMIRINKPGPIHSYAGMMCVSFDLFAKYQLGGDISEAMQDKADLSQLLPLEIPYKNNINPVLFSRKAGGPAAAPAEEFHFFSGVTGLKSITIAPSVTRHPAADTSTAAINDSPTQATTSTRNTPNNPQPVPKQAVSFLYVFLSIITLGLYPLILFICSKLKKASTKSTAPLTDNTQSVPPTPRQSGPPPPPFSDRYRNNIHNLYSPSVGIFF